MQKRNLALSVIQIIAGVLGTILFASMLLNNNINDIPNKTKILYGAIVFFGYYWGIKGIREYLKKE